MAVNTCPYCDRIAAGDYEHDAGQVVFFPSRHGDHLLAVPRAHVAGPADDPEVTGMVFAAAARFAAARHEAFRLMARHGSEAGQSVFHLHVHIMPPGVPWRH